jgi:hypothetical protein
MIKIEEVAADRNPSVGQLALTARPTRSNRSARGLAEPLDQPRRKRRCSSAADRQKPAKTRIQVDGFLLETVGAEDRVCLATGVDA